MYAILDIETTGGKYNEEGITEIAIYRFDGHEIVDQFASLINPERPIQPFVVNLTGINSNMLRNAPKFYEVAKRIIEITDGCVLVAHNAQFDNRILTTEFDRLGYDFNKQTLCTVELAKKLLPDAPSYSLGKLVRTLGIPLSDRHRAQGDAKATVDLFKLLLQKDVAKEIISTYVRKDPKRELDTKLLDMIREAPTEIGVYYLHKEDGTIIYIGSGKNIEKKLTQHFTNENRKSKRLQLEVAAVSYELTGNELIATLKEHEEIKRNKPKFNRFFRRTNFKYQLNTSVDDSGYIQLLIEKADARKKPIFTYANYQQAQSSLKKLCEDHHLCPTMTSLVTGDFVCGIDDPTCEGACTQQESPASYNRRVNDLIEKNSLRGRDVLILGKGRSTNERSVILIEDGKYKGYGFYNLNYQITNPEVLASIITPMPNHAGAQHLIQNYLRKHKNVKTIDLRTRTIN